ncbi:MAG TPA: ANTAR domain-containing protein [Jatrophihabitans sp.]|jgi:hypothetical protein|uniref:ANTAR domain-containing protein n=1 Tax=Jatrophihabitans sp. TaxID=1932789 RepID=UPI002E06C185|nr:ANTAR domain-containing protein [Jatrophihabitans sp.]
MIDEPAVSRPAPHDGDRGVPAPLGPGPSDPPVQLGEGGVPDPGLLVWLAAAAVPHSERASLSSAAPDDGGVRTLAGSDELAEALDAAQREAGHGPFFDAQHAGALVHVPDLADDGRWPVFSARALAAGARAVLGVRLQTGSGDATALTFYADRPHAFEPLDLEIAAAFASFVVLAMEGARYRDQAANLKIALASNRQIGTAMGIIMARELLTAEQAFARLRDVSQRQHRKLRAIADEVVRTGELPGPAAGSRP